MLVTFSSSAAAAAASVIIWFCSLVRSGSFIPFKSQSKPSPLTTTIAAFHPSDQNDENFWDSGLGQLQLLAWSRGFLKKQVASPRRETVSISTYYTGYLIGPCQGWEVDFSVWGRGRKSIMNIPHLGRNPKHQTVRKSKMHPCCSFSQTRNAIIATSALPWGPLRGGRDANAEPLPVLRFPGLTTNPKVSILREPTVQLLSDSSPWCLQGCERVLGDFTSGKTCLCLHHSGIFGIWQENRGQSHLRSLILTWKIQNYT